LYSDVIKGADVILLIGFTGVGKSTLVHFLCGAKMTETVIDGIHHIHPVIPHHRDELLKFSTSYVPKSETRALSAIELR
jgi:ABC-type cobalamin/Fe3+-siderophores transport system ATPase subunit